MNIEALTRQLHYLQTKVPFYQSSVRYGSRLEDFPFVGKPDITMDYGSFISDDYSKKRPHLVRFIEDEQFIREVCFDEEITVTETGGSSGIPFRCPKTVSDRIRLGMGIWRQRRRLDPLIEDRLMYRFTHGGQELDQDTGVDTLSNLKSIYAKIADGRFRWLHASPVVLNRHVEVLMQAGWHPRLPFLKFIECTGAYLSDSDRKTLSEYFGTKVVDQYGMQETWTIALTCIHGVHYINNHNVVLEIIDESFNPVRPGEVGRIVVTSLQERLLPFTRYITGDFGAFVESRCDCGLGATAIKIANGRVHNLIKGISVQLFGNLLFPELVVQARRMVDSHSELHELLYLRVRQISFDEFVIETNKFNRQTHFLGYFTQLTEEALGRKFRFQHVTVEANCIQLEDRKPWVFRCEC